jgi:hypothetical protein
MKLRPGDLDLSNPKTFVEGVPHDYFRVLREEAPLHFQSEFKIPSLKRGPGFWAVTRYETCRTVFIRGRNLFSRDTAPQCGA